MKLRSLELENFRKFRKPIRLDGFADGLNIIIEPNEMGKSTLLEALRAAFFIRHSAKSELVRSYCPFGDDVAPKVGVAFDIGDQHWQLEKQFLKSPHIRPTGNGSRIESDAAEERLQALLGFERGNNRGSDLDTRGVLGLLWVEQATALSAEPPGRVARDEIRAALEGEVGAILGGKKFDRICERIEESYGALRTLRAGKPTGKLAEAEAKLAAARTDVAEAQERVSEYQDSLAELESAQTRKRLIERDLADPEQAERRAKLSDELKLAENAQLRLSTADARHAEAEASVQTTQAELNRLDDATQRLQAAEQALADARAAVEDHQTEFETVAADEQEKREAAGQARTARAKAEQELQQARRAMVEHNRQVAIERAREHLAEILKLEAALAERRPLAEGVIADERLQKLAALDRAVAEARAVQAAGAITLDIDLVGSASVQIDGVDVASGRREVAKPIEVLVPDIARIGISPPAGARSAEAQLRSAEEAFSTELGELGVASYAAAVTRDQTARAAKQDIAALERQIEMSCPGDPVLELKAGVGPLKALIASLPAAADAGAVPADLSELETAFDGMREAEEIAAAVLDEAQKALRAAEIAHTKLEANHVAATHNAATARTLLDEQADQERSAIDQRLQTAREELGRRAAQLSEAQATVANLDIDRIRRAISNIDVAQRQASEERVQLVARIASLEFLVAREGPKGPPGILAEAVEAEAVAEAEVARWTREADVLALLRDALREAAEDTSRTFLGPVTRRAARYVNRILPECDLTFDETMGLTAIHRNGVEEPCVDLSRGTQEQLAVLTRLAFADLLLETGAPVSLILDDPFVYSDDERLEVMTDILLEASKRMQVILLTCRSKAFRHVVGNRISLDQA
jgi:DNA repair exonuclease SbcCD ATPase subunit